MKKIFNRAGINTVAGIYVDQISQEKLILVRVNREYTQKKKPVYYLKQGVKNQKPRYLTGLFATKDPYSFTGDIKDPITGMKNIFTVTFKNEGKTLEIEGAKLWEQ